MKCINNNEIICAPLDIANNLLTAHAWGVQQLSFSPQHTQKAVSQISKR